MRTHSETMPGEAQPRLPWLPRGNTLSTAEWNSRHKGIVAVVLVQLPALFAYAAAVFDVTHAVGEVLVPLAVVSGALHPRLPRNVRMVSAVLGALTLSSTVVHIAGGVTEAHFHFFVMMAVVSLYLHWLPLVVAVVYVAAHHSYYALTVNDYVVAFEGSPATWVAIHGAYIAAAAVVGVFSWRAEERTRDELTRATADHLSLLSALHDAVCSVTADGTVAFANKAACRLLGAPSEQHLVGQNLHAVLHHPPGTVLPDTHNSECAVAHALSPAADDRSAQRAVFHRQDGTTFLADFTVTRSENGRKAVTFHDVSAQALLASVRRETESQRQQLQALIDAIRPDMPDIPAVEFGVAYEPPDGDPVGGDHYDVLALADGSVHICIVDVEGSGIKASQDALSVVHAARHSALLGVPLDKIVEEVDRAVTAAAPDLRATMLVARYHPDSARITVANGGHPPALLVTPGEEPTPLASAGIPVGYPGAGTIRTVEAYVPLGSTVLFYTDGLIESGRDIIQGLDDLSRNVAERAEYPAAVLPRLLVNEVVGAATHRDDTLALALRHVPAEPSHHFRRTLPPEDVKVSLSRSEFSEWLIAAGVDLNTASDAAVVYSELASSAALRSRQDSGSPIEMSCDLTGSSLVIAASDSAQQPADALSTPDVELSLARSVAQVVDVLPALSGRTVTAKIDAPRSGFISISSDAVPAERPSAPHAT